MQIMEGLAINLRSISDLDVYAYPDGQPNVPCAIVGYPEIDYDFTMGRGSDRATYTVFLLVGVADDESARDELAAYLEGSGDRSIKAALEDEPTLTGLVSFVRVVSSNVEEIEAGGITYLSAAFLVDVVA